MGKAKHMRISQRMSQHIIQLKFALRITASEEKPIKPIEMICIYHIQFPLSTLFLFAEVAHDVSGHLQLGQCDFHLTVSQFPLDKEQQMKYKQNNL